MKQNTLGGLVVILFVCILAFSFGAVFAMAHIGEDVSQEILPTSLARSSDVTRIIDEKSFTAENITVKFQTQTKVNNAYKNNTYNATNKTTNKTNYSNQKSYNRSNWGGSSNYSHKQNRI